MRTTFICEAPGWTRFVDVQEDSTEPVQTLIAVALSPRSTRRRQEEALRGRYAQVAQLAVWMGEMLAHTPIRVSCFVEDWTDDQFNRQYPTFEVTINEDAIVTLNHTDTTTQAQSA